MTRKPGLAGPSLDVGRDEFRGDRVRRLKLGDPLRCPLQFRPRRRQGPGQHAFAELLAATASFGMRD